MSARSYLSIGDVLTLLRQEFPDVTISKIRFLESQGLVNPERTPSGYRKFYEHDVERLRWVLRQQREHFLPLKVIKDRLDEDAGGAESAAPASAGAKQPAGSGETAKATSTEAAPAGNVPVGRPVPAAASEPVLVGQRVSSTDAAESGTTASGPPSALPGIQPAPSRPAASSVPAADPPAERAHRASLAAPPHRAADATADATARAESPARSSGNGSASHGTPAPAAKPAARASRSAAGTTTTSPAAAAGAPGTDPEAGAAPAAATIGGASLSLDELRAESGLSAEYVGQLQEYGLLRASVVGGTEYFDEEAVTVATVAAKFAAFGIEARHLRLYKNATDREAGFIEQVVIPMVRQRNPEARARAAQTADDLAGLGQQLKGSLLRTALRDLLNG